MPRVKSFISGFWESCTIINSSEEHRGPHQCINIISLLFKIHWCPLLPYTFPVSILYFHYGRYSIGIVITPFPSLHEAIRLNTYPFALE